MNILTSATKLALLISVVSVVGLNIANIPVEEPLKTIAVMIVSYYFGNRNANVVNTIK